MKEDVELVGHVPPLNPEGTASRPFHGVSAGPQATGLSSCNFGDIVDSADGSCICLSERWGLPLGLGESCAVCFSFPSQTRCGAWGCWRLVSVSTLRAGRWTKAHCVPGPGKARWSCCDFCILSKDTHNGHSTESSITSAQPFPGLTPSWSPQRHLGKERGLETTFEFPQLARLRSAV